MFLKNNLFKYAIIFIVVLVGLFVILFFLPYILNLFAKDIPPIDDSDILLNLPEVAVPENENAFYDLNKISESYSLLLLSTEEEKTILDILDNKISLSGENKKIIENVIIKNTEILKIFSEFKNKPKYQNPDFLDFTNSSKTNGLFYNHTYFNPALILKTARLNAVQLLLLAQEKNLKKDKEEIDGLIELLKAGQKIQNSTSITLSEYLIGREINKIGLIAITRIIPFLNLTPIEFKKYIQEIDSYKESNRNNLVNILKFESYYIFALLIDSIGNNDNEKNVFSNFYFQPNKTKLFMADNSTRPMIKNIQVPCSEIQSVKSATINFDKTFSFAPNPPFFVVNLLNKIYGISMPDFYDYNIDELSFKKWIKFAMKFYVTENAIGKIMYDNSRLIINEVEIIKKDCQNFLLSSAAQTLMAIKFFKDDTGDYPTSLGELIPHYLPYIPLNPFNNKPIEYSPGEKTLYSAILNNNTEGDNDFNQLFKSILKINF